jgi:hypothetical protein
MNHLRPLKPTVMEPLGKDLDLIVTAASADAAGRVTANLQLWNGTILAENTLALFLELPRRRFANTIVQRVTGVDATLVEDTLLRLSVGLPATLRAQAVNVSPVVAPDPEVLWQACEAIACDPKLLDRVADALRRQGLVGERRNGLLLYLALTSRLLERPVSVFVKGPSSGGKSFVIRMTIATLPDSAYVDYTAVSAKYLAYADVDLRHRIVVLYEAGGIADGVGAYIMRSLLSEGRLDIGTVEKGGDGNGSHHEARHIVTEGPTMLVTSTTRASLDPELETRALTLTVIDTPPQTREVVRGIGRSYASRVTESVDLAPFKALQEWLAVAGERRVRIPWAKILAEQVPVTAVRMRRDISKLFGLISACAILHQARRPRDDDGAIVATLDDYTAVRELLAESFAAAQQEGITPAQREAVEAVVTLCRDEKLAVAGVSLRQVAEQLKIDKSAASRRLANPLEAGYVRDLNVDNQGKHRTGRKAAYVVGDPLPPPEDALPTVETVHELIASAEQLRDVTL